MSVRVMAWVWEQSQSKGMDRLVLLAIADCAADDGGSAFPSMAKLVAKTGLTDRGVQKCMARLVELGELVVHRNAGPRGCNRYRVSMRTPERRSPPNSVHPEPGSPPNSVHPEPGSPPRTAFTPNDVHPPEHGSPPPPNHVRETPEPRSPGTIPQPSVEPSVKPSSSKAVAVRDEPRPDVEQICQHLADLIEANGSKRPNVTKTWRDAGRRLIDRDRKTVEQIIKAIDWCQDDEFWRSNILSMPKLREKYEQLRLAAQRSSRNGHKPSTTDQRVAQGMALAAKLDAMEKRS